MRRELEIPVEVAGHALAVGVSVDEAAAGAAGSAPVAADVVYLHGGGLLYGRRDDLPACYVDAFCARGHRLWSLDYPLAPEAPAAQIVRCVGDELAWLARNEGLGADRPLVLFGRSAGAYLALAACRDLVAAHGAAGTDNDGTAGGPSPTGGLAQAVSAPVAVLSFYGYADLTSSFVHEPSPHYAAMPPLSDSTVCALTGDEPLTQARIERRFALYLYR